MIIALQFHLNITIHASCMWCDSRHRKLFLAKLFIAFLMIHLFAYLQIKESSKK